MNRRTIRTIIPLVALLCVGGVIYHLFGNPFDPFDNNYFSVETWRKASAGRDLDARAGMCRDLMKRFIPPGTTAKQVVALLGAPSSIDEAKPGDDEPMIGTHRFKYHVGNWSMHGMDDAFLYVHFDKDDRVIKTQIYGY
ncbi:MAG: hypothetical protein QOG67_34 [Verrucomicrobiota bacterium]|jgi:hypothetical protein